ncbi:holo-ACP synthase [Thermovibrio sp.]
MLVSVGVDLISVERFKRLYERFGERLLKKLFPEGVDYCFKKRRGELYGCLAARFALKEATVKALSQIGIKVPVSKVKVLGGGRELQLKVEGLKGCRLLFSISHEKEFAVAVVNVLKESSNKKPPFSRGQ